MENNNYLFESKLRLSNIVITFFVPIWSMWLLYAYQFGIPSWVLIFMGTLLIYLILAILQSRYYFYDDHIVRVFIFRPFCRKKVFRYEQLYKIKYKSIGSRGEYPKFIVYQKKKQYLKYFNNFVFNKPSDRVKIVEFLLSKNVKMEVRTDFEKKDKEIIDMVKKKYPQNIRLYP